MTARKRKLLIEVECGDAECGPCESHQPRQDGLGGYAFCRVFMRQMGVHERHPECLAAEQQAKPKPDGSAVY